MSEPPVAPITAPRNSRARLLALNALVATIVSTAAFVLALASPYALPFLAAAVGTVLAVTFALAGLNVARQWNDRIELRGDHIVERHGRSERTISLDEVVSIDATRDLEGTPFDPHYEPTQGIALSSEPVPLTLRLKQGPAVVLRGDSGALAPVLTALNAAFLRQIRGQLARGETVVFADRGRLPVFSLFTAGASTLVALAALEAILRGKPAGGGAGQFVLLLLLGYLSWTGLKSAYRALRRWSSSRKNRGLAVSSRGVVPLTELRPGAETVVGYRVAYGAAAPWVPWSDLAWSRLDHEVLTVKCGAREDAFVFNPKTESIVALQRLLSERIEAERVEAASAEDNSRDAGQDPRTGVRVTVQTEAESVSADADSDAVEDSRGSLAQARARQR